MIQEGMEIFNCNSTERHILADLSRKRGKCLKPYLEKSMLSIR